MNYITLRPKDFLNANLNLLCGVGVSLTSAAAALTVDQVAVQIFGVVEGSYLSDGIKAAFFVVNVAMVFRLAPKLPIARFTKEQLLESIVLNVILEVVLRTLNLPKFLSIELNAFPIGVAMGCAGSNAYIPFGIIGAVVGGPLDEYVLDEFPDEIPDELVEV